jgi:hypothetical protein
MSVYDLIEVYLIIHGFIELSLIIAFEIFFILP